MANTQINITENGTKTLATAGKYCDRNIDVNVNVPVKPTQFTNVLDLPTTIVKEGYRAITNNYSETSDGVAVVIFLKKGTHDIRVRGKWAWWWLELKISESNSNARTNVYFSTTTPTNESHGGSLLVAYDSTSGGNNPIKFGNNTTKFNIDEYGDWYMTVTTTQDGYLAFTLKDISEVYAGSGTFNCDPIITIDEPIGIMDTSDNTMHRKEYNGEVVSTVLGKDAYAVLAKDAFLAEHRNDETLFVRVEFDIEPTAYTVVKNWATNVPYELVPLNANTLQQTYRFDANASRSLGNIIVPLNTDSPENVGCLQVTADGELRCYSNSGNYAIRPSNYKVVVEW